MHSGENTPHLARIGHTLDQHVTYLLTAARSAPAGGGPAWEAALAHYGVAPETAAFRARALAEMRVAQGALPVELRRALEAVAARAESELAWLRAHAPFIPGDAGYAPLLARIAHLAATETARYEAQLRPAAAGGGRVGSLFANAKATSQKTPWADFKVEASRALGCASCGATQQTVLDFTCSYCGASLAAPKP